VGAMPKWFYNVNELKKNKNYSYFEHFPVPFQEITRKTLYWKNEDQEK
jgi:hypothetical protein